VIDAGDARPAGGEASSPDPSDRAPAVAFHAVRSGRVGPIASARRPSRTMPAPAAERGGPGRAG